MIALFPPAYPDETLENRCARYLRLLGYSQVTDAVRDLFGPGRRTVSVDLPAGLGHLVENLPPGHGLGVEALARQHTLFPYFAPFLSRERRAWVLAQMTANRGGAVHAGSGIMASRISAPAFLRYCPDCVREDRARCGESYWRRVHQVAGVLVCPMHAAVLHESSVRYRRRRGDVLLTRAEDHIPSHRLSQPKPAFPHDWQAHLVAVARQTLWLLDQQSEFGAQGENWQALYRHELYHRGFLTHRGSLHIARLRTAFLNVFPSELLQLLQAEINLEDAETWLERLLRRPQRFHHPLLHLLVIRFLDHTVASLTAAETNTAYFGAGPWPCLNAACKHHHRPVITEFALSFSRDSGRPVGSFACPHCGMRYARVGPDQSPADQLRMSRCETFGPIWEAALGKLWSDNNVSLRAKARRLGVDPRTVQRHAARLGLAQPLSVSRRAGAIDRPTGPAAGTEKCRAMRLAWLTARSRNPDATTTELRQMAPAAAAWLYRHDREWFDAHKPSARRRRRQDVRVDWTLRDLQTTTACIRSLVELMAEDSDGCLGNPARRLTRTAVARNAGVQGLLPRRAEKMPLAASILARLAESRREFAVRRVWCSAYRCLESREPGPRWQLIRASGTSRLSDEECVRGALSEAENYLLKGGRVAVPAQPGLLSKIQAALTRQGA